LLLFLLQQSNVAKQDNYLQVHWLVPALTETFLSGI